MCPQDNSVVLTPAFVSCSVMSEVASVDTAFGWGKMQSSFCSHSGYSCGNLTGRFIFSLHCVTVDG